MSKRLLLAGGGEAEDSRLLDERFASWIGPEGKVLYLPVAMLGSDYSFDAAYKWITAVFSPLGLTTIEMWTSLSDHVVTELQEFDGVYIGGGNTFSLLAHLRETQFDSGLAEFAAHGGIIYGGSAGAIVLGRDIMTSAHMDANEVGLSDFMGLDLAQAHGVWCHYEAGADPLIESWVKDRGIPVLAIPERGGVAVTGNRCEPVGFDPVYLFAEHGKQLL